MYAYEEKKVYGTVYRRYALPAPFGGLTWTEWRQYKP